MGGKEGGKEGGRVEEEGRKKVRWKGEGGACTRLFGCGGEVGGRYSSTGVTLTVRNVTQGARAWFWGNGLKMPTRALSSPDACVTRRANASSANEGSEEGARGMDDLDGDGTAPIYIDRSGCRVSSSRFRVAWGCSRVLLTRQVVSLLALL